MPRSGRTDVPRPYHAVFLEEELQRRKERNPRYSLRAFSSQLGLDPSALSRILRGRQEISIRTCLQVLRKLNLPDETKRLFIASVAEERSNRALALLSRAINLDLDLKPLPEAQMREIVDARGRQPIEPDRALAMTHERVRILDHEGRHLYLNEKAALDLQIVPCEAIGKTLADLGWAPEASQAVQERVALVYSTGKTHRMQISVRGARLRARKFEVRFTPLVHRAGVKAVLLNEHPLAPG